MWILGVFSVLFYSGFVYRLATDQDIPNMVVQVAGGTVLGALFLYFRRERRRDEELLRSLGRMAPDTELRVFEACVSVILLTVKLPTRHYVVGRDSTLPPRLVCIFTSLLLGWWGIPWGPIWTLQTLARTAAGGHELRAGDLAPVVPVQVIDVATERETPGR